MTLKLPDVTARNPWLTETTNMCIYGQTNYRNKHMFKVGTVDGDVFI